MDRQLSYIVKYQCSVAGETVSVVKTAITNLESDLNCLDNEKTTLTYRLLKDIIKTGYMIPNAFCVLMNTFLKKTLDIL